MRALPKHVYRHAKGYRVQVRRKRVLYSAFVACMPGCAEEQHAAAIAEAVRLADRFISLLGAPTLLRTTAHSNTGIAGICETIDWRHNRPMHHFQVYIGAHHQPHTKRFYYGDVRPRSVALKRAVDLRRSLGAIITEEAVLNA